MAVWQAMTPGDLPQVNALADRLHPDHPEDPAIFSHCLSRFATGCFILRAEDFRACGYSISYPWRDRSPPPLNRLSGALPLTPDTYYIHDVALLPETRGKGYAKNLVKEFVSLAQRLKIDHLSLVAVNGSVPFWQKNGFQRGRFRKGAESYVSAFSYSFGHLYSPVSRI